MSALPCKNPNCSSFNKPHPNCRCYGGLAEGGEVHFCAQSRAHEPGCEYFAEGGATPAPPDGFEMESQSPDVANNIPAPPPGFEVQDASASAPPPGFEIESPEPDKYSSTSSKVGAAAEGLGQGLAGPLSTLFETKVLGIPKEDIKGRAEAHPYIHGAAEAAGLGAGFLAGTGEAGLIARGAEAIVPGATIGAKVLRGMIETGAIQGGDEISKAMLGQGDPEAPVATALMHVGAASLLGGAAGGAFGVASNKLQGLADLKLSQKATDFLTTRAPELFPMFVDNGISTMGRGIGAKLGATIGGALGGIPGAIPGAVTGATMGEKAITPYLQKALGVPLKRFGAPLVLRALSQGNVEGISQLLCHAENAMRGSDAAVSGIDSLFKSGATPALDLVSSEMDRKKLDKFIENSELDQQIDAQKQDSTQSFAHGGEVKKPVFNETPVLAGTDALSKTVPDQSALMMEAKGRIYNYLKSIRPQSPTSKLAFDSDPSQKEAQKKYNKALDIANKPLGILNSIKTGNITPDELGHFKALYPEVHNYLSKKMTDRITQAQVKNEKPDYHVRQAMSLFLGAPLDSTLTAQAGQAAQSVFMQQAAQKGQGQGQPAPKQKGNKSKLGDLPKQYRLPQEAAMIRQQSQR